MDRVRDHLPAAELFSLADYRTRHAQYRTDPDLQAAHATHPFLMTWDDHEFKDNYANLDLDPDQPLLNVTERRAAAYLAYWEHAPLARSRKPVGKDMSLYRRARWGDLATFHVLDTRQYRSDQMVAQCTQAERDPVSSYCPVQLDPTRTLLGAEQREWLFEGLAAAPASGWNILANQVGFAPQANFVSDRRRFNADSWDGYVADRQRVLDFLKQHDIKNTVVITGDKHQNSVRNVPESYTDLAGPAVATEFVGTSISSEGNTPPNTTYGGDPNNPHILFENFQRGYVRVTLEPERWTNDFRVVETVSRSENVPTTTLATFVVEHGKPGATRAEERSVARVTRRLERRPDDPAKDREREAAASPPAPRVGARPAAQRRQRGRRAGARPRAGGRRAGAVPQARAGPRRQPLSQLPAAEAPGRRRDRPSTRG